MWLSRKLLAELDRRTASLREKEEAPPGFEPGMVDLQSTALATWLRRLPNKPLKILKNPMSDCDTKYRI